MNNLLTTARSRLAGSLPSLGWLCRQLGPLEWAFAVIALAAAAMRLWELDGRVMHYDEAIHLHYAWNLARGVEYLHSPWMHGPFQIELVAVFIKVLGDTDFVARLPYALFGVALVILPWFLRREIGDKGAVCAAVILTFSPSLLYFSRFGRNDILMVVWATLLLIFLWRYTQSSRRRYLLGAAAVTALMFASKETAYFVTLFMGLTALVLGWRQLWGLLRRPAGIAGINGAGGFFILMATLTLPQAAAAIAVAQGPLGLTLTAPEHGSSGETGAPVWEAPFVPLPVWDAPIWLHALALAALLGAALALARFRWRIRGNLGAIAVAVTTACGAAAVSLVIAGLSQSMAPGSGLIGPTIYYGAGVGLMLAGGAMAYVAPDALSSWRRTATLLGVAALATLLWLALFGDGLSLGAKLLPFGGTGPELEVGQIALNHLIALATLLLLLVIGGVVGIAWGGGVWLLCAGLFYVIWTTLYTTFFTNWPGVFTGSWQSLGYWLAQQGVARGNQPWYYYIIGLTVYELLAFAFGIAAVVWLIRRREPFGLVLAAWVIATMVMYTVAAEKMPWLLVNITVPLALGAGMLLGSLIQGMPWPSEFNARWRLGALFAGAPAWLALAVWTVWLAARGDAGTLPVWLTLLALLPLAAGLAWLVRKQPHGGKAIALGLATLLLLFGTVSALRAAYTYDDSRLEILAYAQGSADLARSYEQLRAGPLTGQQDSAVKVDYDMWYPFQWYVRHETEQGTLRFDHFCDATADGSSDQCRKVAADLTPQVYLAESAHAVNVEDAEGYERQGPLRNLLWYPETYRRPGEDREETAFWRQLASDMNFFVESATDREKWRQAIEYIVTRRQQSDWYTAEYYQYTRH